MRAGLLNEFIIIKRSNVTISESGQKVSSYERVTRTRSRVIYVNGDRTEKNKDIVWTTNLKFEIWDYVDVKEQDIVEFDDKEYRIKSVEHDKVQQKKIIYVEKITE